VILFSGLNVNILSNRSIAVDKQNYSHDEVLGAKKVRGMGFSAFIAKCWLYGLTQGQDKMSNLS